MSGTATRTRGEGIAPDSARGKADVSRLLGLSLSLRVVLAERQMPLDSVLTIRPGTIIEFEVPFDAELVLYAGNRAIGVGQAVKVGEKFGLRVSNIDAVRHAIESLSS